MTAKPGETAYENEWCRVPDVVGLAWECLRDEVYGLGEELVYHRLRLVAGIRALSPHGELTTSPMKVQSTGLEAHLHRSWRSRVRHSMTRQQSPARLATQPGRNDVTWRMGSKTQPTGTCSKTHADASVRGGSIHELPPDVGRAESVPPTGVPLCFPAVSVPPQCFDPL